MTIKTGDRVAYAVQFLRSINALTGDMPHERGTVKSVREYPCFTLAEIQWDDDQDLPKKVNVKNLAIVGPNSRFAACD